MEVAAKNREEASAVDDHLEVSISHRGEYDSYATSAPYAVSAVSAAFAEPPAWIETDSVVETDSAVKWAARIGEWSGRKSPDVSARAAVVL